MGRCYIIAKGKCTRLIPLAGLLHRKLTQNSVTFNIIGYVTPSVMPYLYADYNHINKYNNKSVFYDNILTH